MSLAKKITLLKSSDGEAFEVDEAVLLESQTIKNMIEDGSADSGILVPNVTSETLAKVIEYCKKHVEAANPEDKPSEDEFEAWVADLVKVDLATLFDELKAWDADFVKVDLATLFELILAADYLRIMSLRSLACQAVADLIKGMTPEEIHTFFNTARKIV